MCYWEFLQLLNNLKEFNARKAGKSVVKDKVPQSNKDMIQRMKDMHG